MEELIKKIDLNNNIGLITINTLSGSHLHFAYEREKTTIEDILKSFNENYSIARSKDKVSIHDFETNELIIGENNNGYDKKLLMKYLFRQVTKWYLATYNQPARPGRTLMSKMIESLTNKENEKKIMIKTPTDRQFYVQYDPNMTIETLKIIVESIECYSRDALRLICKGKQLEDHYTLSDYGIENGETIFLCYRLRGGMYSETSGKNGNYLPLESNLIFVNLDKNLVLGE